MESDLDVTYNQTDVTSLDEHCQNTTLFEICPTMYAELYGYQQFYLCLTYLQGYMSYEEVLTQERAKTVIYGVLLNIVCLAGIVGNILSYITMKSKEYRGSTTAIYLQVLMIADSLYLLGNFIYYGIIQGYNVGQWMVTPHPAYIRIFLIYILVDIFRNCSVLLTLVVTMESLRANMLTPKLSKIVSAITVGITVVYEIPRFFVLEVQVSNYTNCDGYIYSIENSDRMHIIDGDVVGVIGFVVFLALPLIGLTILTVLLLKTVKRSVEFRKSMRSTMKSSVSDKESSSKGKSSETNTTVILLSVVITSIICSLPNTVLMLLRYSFLGDTLLLSLPGSITFYIAVLLLNINSAVNVLLFCFFGKKFRRVFKRVFCKGLWREKLASYRAVSQTAHTHVENDDNEGLEMESKINERTCLNK